MCDQTVSVINMSRKRKVDDVDWSGLENAREHKRVLVLKGQLQRFDKLSLFDRFRHVENGFDINF